jgi:NADH-quinone oxidoreductase subunit F
VSRYSVLLENINKPDLHLLDVYQQTGGYQAIQKALSMSPQAVVAEVKAAGLRGRGGAGFPTGVKWGFVASNSGKPVYLIQNADESEPGTFKDRLLLERNPHLCIEGMLIAAWALQSNWSCIYVRGEYVQSYLMLKQALEQCYAKGYLGADIFGSGFKHEIVLHRGAGAYICGEETALLQSLEGRRGQPRIKPPFPASAGLYGCPTVINNTETLANLPWIIKNGAKAFCQIGTEKSPGTKLISVSGHINRPGVYEIEMGYALLDFINIDCGGMRGGAELKAVIPGGSSVPILKAEELAGVTLDYESLQQAGSMLGSGGMIVMDQSTDMVDVALSIARFYACESCGQCTPCREGTYWLEQVLTRIGAGSCKEGDADLIGRICDQIASHTICPFGDAVAAPLLAIVRKFRDEFEKRMASEPAFQQNISVGGL